jgi:hypothetical protein
MFSMKKLLRLSFFLSFSLYLFSCEDKNVDPPAPPKPVEKAISSKIVNRWIDGIIHYIKFHPNNSPVYSSRNYGYFGLAMYESTVPGSIIYKSIAPQLNGLGTIAAPANKDLDWETALNESQYYLMYRFYQHGSKSIKVYVDTLYNNILTERSVAVNDSNKINRSKEFGTQVAKAIYEWSLNDGGNLAYLNNFSTNYILPKGEQYWVPPLAGQSSILLPLQPTWGKTRTFLAKNTEIPIPEFLMFSKEKTSAYYKQFEEINTISNNLTQEQKEIAIWWADDPSDSGAPGGHSLNIGKIINQDKKLNLFEATSMVAKVGMSVADAFICCWKVKYTYHTERPAGYIRRNINGAYNQFWPEPPFPAYPSGHATQVGAAGEALKSVFGDNVSFIDNTHQGKTKDFLRNVEYKNRSFNKISDMVNECGISRLYGNIHISKDNEDGKALGAKVGENVVGLSWKY